MENYYKILGVRPDASISEIRRAYRKKAKEFHPDSSGDSATADAFRALVRAYETLCDSKQRELFDESYFMHRERSKKGSSESFDYRQWLLKRTDEESRAKLIFFDLMHNREDDAVHEFKETCMNNAGFRLSHWFTREDFMDYGFILCEELVLRREYYDAVILLEQIIKMEYSFNYFRLFFPEVMDLARNILLFHIEGEINDELALDCWERALELGFGKKTDRIFLLKMANAYERIGDLATSRICRTEAARL